MTGVDLHGPGAGNTAANGSTAPDATEYTPLIANPPLQQRSIIKDDDNDTAQHSVTPMRAACICFSMWALMFMQGE